MKRKIGNYQIVITDEPAYRLNAGINRSPCINEYCRSDKYENSSAHGIVVTEHEALLGSAVLLGIGGGTGVSDNSVASDGSNLYVVAGDALFSLSIPALELIWCTRVDFATCFGVYWLEDRNCLLTWGELEIGCYSTASEKLWGATGSDIFTEGFEIESDRAKVTDFNGDVYAVNLSNGQITRVSH